MQAANGYGTFLESGNSLLVDSSTRAAFDSGSVRAREKVRGFECMEKVYLIGGVGVLLGTFILGLFFSPLPLGLKADVRGTGGETIMSREDYVRAATGVFQAEGAIERVAKAAAGAKGCCFSVGYGDGMLPCCLDIQSAQTAVGGCLVDGRLGGMTAWLPGTCPRSAREAIQRLKSASAGFSSGAEVPPR